MKKLIFETALNTLRIETETLQRLQAESLDDDFVATVMAIFAAKGRLIVTGIGKSAIVGQKIVATLNSTGTPAIFMHAADAIHGDLGMILPHDILLCLSKSGATAEIKVLVPLVKHRGNLLIGMVAQRASYLGQQSDYILYTPIAQEADPNNLAPTASTTAQMALGDALATALLALRGFSSQDFAQIHPGGALGKQLYLRVSDLYTLHAKPAVFPDDHLKRVIVEMTTKRLGATAVINQQNQVLGIVTDGDLRRMLERSISIETLRAQDIMTATPKIINANELAVSALSLMREKSITQLLVVDDSECYVGMVHLHDLIREGIV